MKKLLILSLVLLSYTSSAETFIVNQGLTSSKALLTEVAKVTECVIAKKEFLAEVQARSYDMTKKTGSQVMATIFANTNVIKAKVTTYKSKIPWSKSIAYRNVGDDTIYFNTRKITDKRSFPEMVNTLVHEWLHLLGFDHGGNKNVGKSDTVNYAVGSIAEKHVEGCK